MSLTRRARRFFVLLHVLASVSWIGVDLVIGVLSFTGLSTDDPRTMATAYTALSMFCVPLLLTLGLLALGTGVTLGLGTRYGLVRHWWVAVKLVVTLALSLLVVVALRPTLAQGAAESTLVDATLAERLDLVRKYDLPSGRLDRGPAVHHLARRLQAVGFDARPAGASCDCPTPGNARPPADHQT